MRNELQQHRDISDIVIKILTKSGLCLLRVNRVNENGTQLVLDNGSIVTCYDTGKFLVQGQNQELARNALQSVLPESCMTRSEKKLYLEKQASDLGNYPLSGGSSNG